MTFDYPSFYEAICYIKSTASLGAVKNILSNILYYKSVMDKLSREKIRSLCTAESYERGLEYLKEKRVTNLGLSSDGKATSTVLGSQKYRVEIDLIARDFDASCTCPYDWGGYCKHIVATLLALSKDYQQMQTEMKKEEDRINVVLDEIGEEEIKGFLRSEFKKNAELKTHFLIYTTGTGEKEKSLDDYKKEIALLYREEAGKYGIVEYGNNIDFSSFRELAGRYIERQNYLEAAKVYHALSEAIAENMNIVDDSNGYYGEEFSEAMGGLVSSLNKAKLSHEAKAKYIDYMFKKYREKDTDYFEDEYNATLERLCTTKEDLEYWNVLLAPHLPKTIPNASKSWNAHYNAKELLLMQTSILKSLLKYEDDHEKRERYAKMLYELLGKYSPLDEDFCLLYAEQLKEDEAVRVAEENLSRFPHHLTKELRLFLNELYKGKQIDKYRQNLRELFLQDGDWDYYDKLKKLCSDEVEWQKEFNEIVGNLSRRGQRVYDYDEHLLIDIYLKEKRFDKALGEVLSKKSLQLLDRYYSQLSEKYPHEYFKAYSELLPPFADSRVGRDHYHQVAMELKKMKGLKGSEEEFRELLIELRERYAKKPAFMDEIRRL